MEDGFILWERFILSPAVDVGRLMMIGISKYIYTPSTYNGYQREHEAIKNKQSLF